MYEDDNARACKLSHACIMLEIIDCYSISIMSHVQKPLLATLWHHHFCQLWQSRAVLFAIFGNLVQRSPYKGKSQLPFLANCQKWQLIILPYLANCRIWQLLMLPYLADCRKWQLLMLPFMEVTVFGNYLCCHIWQIAVNGNY